MAAVIVTTLYNAPIRLEDIFQAVRQGGWCLTMYGGSTRFHSISGDGLRSLCVYDAPDAEAMRNVTRMVGLAPTIWAATIHPAADDDPSRPPELTAGEAVLAMVEYGFNEPADFPTAQATFCLVTHGVRFIRSYLSLDRRTMVSLYAAPDLEAIRAAHQMAGQSGDAIWITKPNYPA
jgi:Nickel responsive protein SCO4226-like